MPAKDHGLDQRVGSRRNLAIPQRFICGTRSLYLVQAKGTDDVAIVIGLDFPSNHGKNVNIKFFGDAFNGMLPYQAMPLRRS